MKKVCFQTILLIIKTQWNFEVAVSDYGINNNRAGIQLQLQVGMCIQRIFKYVCASTQSGQSLSFPPIENGTLGYP